MCTGMNPSQHYANVLCILYGLQQIFKWMWDLFVLKLNLLIAFQAVVTKGDCLNEPLIGGSLLFYILNML